MIHLDAVSLLLVAAAAAGAGAVNAIAGGGTLLSFPALLLLGFPALTANVTNTLGLLPGYAGGSLAYRAELSVQRERVRFLGPISIIGALVGAILLTRTSNRVVLGDRAVADPRRMCAAPHPAGGDLDASARAGLSASSIGHRCSRWRSSSAEPTAPSSAPASE